MSAFGASTAQALGLLAGASSCEAKISFSCANGSRCPAKTAFSHDVQSLSWHAAMPGLPAVRTEGNLAKNTRVSGSSRGPVRVSAAGRPPSFMQSGASTSQAGSGQDLYLPFRRPAEDPSVDASASNEEKLEILRERRGLWHEYAPSVTSLQRAGYTPAVIDESTGMNGVEQNMVVVAAQVYNSLKTSGMPPESLSYFDVGGAEVLYELRILSIQQRQDAAEYVIGERLDAQGACQVARAIKEHERRKGEEGRDSFSNTPGDCLAFAFFRQSKESRAERDKESWLKKALEVATTDSARRAIDQAGGLLQCPEAAPLKAAVTARIEAFRLFKQETVTRPVPVVGRLEDLNVAALFRTSSEAPLDGPFGIFTPAAGSRWVALPGWSPLLAAKRPAAIEVPDTQQLPTFESKSSSEALLLVERGNDDGDVQLDSYYVTAKADGSAGLSIVAGSDVVERNCSTLGRVLLLLLPPQPVEEEEEIEDWE